LNPEFAISFLGLSYKISVAVCADPTLPLTDLKTLILEDIVSIFKIFIFSVPTVNISFSRIYDAFKFPPTEKYVTNPVTAVVPTAATRDNVLMVEMPT